MSYTFDAVLLGAGIAGLSLADALQSRGWSVCIIDKKAVGSGASGTPGAMINPATGRRATKVWKAEQCYQAVFENLQKLQDYAREPFWHKNGVLRPAITSKMARKMKKQYEKTTWQTGWCQWLDRDKIQLRHPGITCVKGGLWLPVGITLNSKKYLQVYAQYLEQHGVKILEFIQPTGRKKNEDWLIETSEKSYLAKNLIYTTGQNTINSKYWSDLPLHHIKGQVAIFQYMEGSLNFSHSISSLGYMARLPGQPDTFVQGSTYEHDFEHAKPDNDGEKYLRERLKRTLPKLEPNLRTINQWSGVRVSTPDRKPVLGTHMDYSDLHIFCGLGSKGLMYGKFLANHYADYLTSGAPLLPEVDVSRMYNN